MLVLAPKPLGGQQDPRRRRLAELLDEIGEELTIPPLNERLDLDYVIRSVTHDIDAEKIITVEAERILAQHYWVTGSAGCARPCARSSATARASTSVRNIWALFFVKLMTTANLPELLGYGDQAQQMPDHPKSWRDNNGNVSMVSRKLGLSRTTIYAHWPLRRIYRRDELTLSGRGRQVRPVIRLLKSGTALLMTSISSSASCSIRLALTS